MTTSDLCQSRTMNNNLNNKIEIFKLAIAAGTHDFTDDQLNFLVDCFKKAEELSRSHSNPHPSRKGGFRGKPRGGKPQRETLKKWTGRSLFLRGKMAELKTNGQSFHDNKQKAIEEWEKLSIGEKVDWDLTASKEKSQ